MRVLLIDPAGAQRYVTHNAGLAYLSSALLAQGHDVRVLDMNNYGYTNEEVAEYAGAFKPEWVGASVKTALVSSAEATMRAIRAVAPQARTIVGGAHIGVAALKQLREIKAEGYSTTKIYSKTEGSANVRAAAAAS